ncbi:MAG: nucleotide exchange factor GrpE, partial [Elusimicrobiota bacterium]
MAKNKGQEKPSAEAPSAEVLDAAPGAAAADGSGEQPPSVPAAGPSAAGTAREENGPRADKALLDQLLRLKAEFENYRKRVDRDRPQWERAGKSRLLERLLPLYDVLLSAHEAVLRHKERLEGSEELATGLELIFKEFTKLFEAEGVAVIMSLGKPYDFNLHEVLGQVETAEAPEGTVVDEV